MEDKIYPIHDLPLKIRKIFPHAITVEDATESITIEVQSTDVASAEPMEPMSCALAKACQREYQADGVYIGLSRSYVLKGTHLIRYTTPNTVQREIVAFDRHKDFEPGVYRLSKVAKHNSMAYPKKPRKHARRKIEGTPIPKHFTSRVRTS